MIHCSSRKKALQALFFDEENAKRKICFAFQCRCKTLICPFFEAAYIEKVGTFDVYKMYPSYCKNNNGGI